MIKKGQVAPLFIRLFFIYGLTLLIILILIGWHFSPKRDVEARRMMYRNFRSYAESIIKDIGIPPDFDKAFEVAGDRGLKILIRAPDTVWTSDPGMVRDWRQQREKKPPPPFLRPFTRRFHHDRGWGKGWMRVRKGPYLFVFKADIFSETRRENATSLFPLLLMILLTVTGSFLWVRYTLRPLSWLDEGAKELAGGNLEHRVPEKGTGELRYLAVSFNSMASRLQHHLRSLQELLLSLSHEFRSPLTRMKLALEFVNDPKIRESLNEEITRLDRLTGSLLERERLQVPEVLRKSPVNILSWLEEVVSLYQQRKPGLVFKGQGQDDCEGKFDVDRVSLCLGNVLENAFRYSQENGPPVEVSWAVSGDFLEITVRDHGPGFAPEELARLGEPFYRGKKEKNATNRQITEKGFGLGLNLSRSIARAHGGDLELSNHTGQDGTIRGAQVKISIKI